MKKVKESRANLKDTVIIEHEVKHHQIDYAPKKKIVKEYKRSGPVQVKKKPGKYDQWKPKDDDLFTMPVSEPLNDRGVVPASNIVDLSSDVEETQVSEHKDEQGVTIKSFIEHPSVGKPLLTTYAQLGDAMVHESSHQIDSKEADELEHDANAAFGFFENVPEQKQEAPKPHRFEYEEEGFGAIATNAGVRTYATVEEYEDAQRQRILTEIGISRKKKKVEKARIKELAAAADVKKIDRGVARKQKKFTVDSWIQDLDSAKLFSGEQAPKPKHQKKTRSRKKSTLTDQPYTKEEVHEFRAKQAEKRRAKKMVWKAKTESYNIISDYLDANLGKQQVAYIEWMINFVELIHNVCKYSDRTIRTILLKNWMQAQGVRWAESTLISTFVSAIITKAPKIENLPDVEQKHPRRATTQALSEELDKFGDILEYAFDSTFADSIKNFFISCASMGMFGVRVDGRIFRYLGAPMKLPFYDLTRIAVKSLAKVVKAMEDVNDGVPMSEALFMKDPWVYNRTKYSSLMLRQHHLYTGIPVEGKFPKPIWLKECDEVLAYMKHRRSMTSSLKPQYQEICTMIIQLEEAKCNVVQTLSGGYRNAPFAICVGDLPGIGKSNLIDFFAYEWCQVQAMPFRPDLIFHRDMTSEFWDGLSSQIVYHYSEVGTASKKIAESKGDEAAMELTSIIDSVMKNVNMAAVDLKGRVKALPQLVIADTNNFSMNFQHMTMNEAAFRRRFLFIRATVKPQYKFDHSCQIDWSKCNDGTHPLDRWHFDAWIERAINQKESTKITLLQAGDIYALSKLLRKSYADHLKSQTFIEEMRKDNKMFKLDPDEKEAPDDTPFMRESSPVGKSLVENMLNSASEYAKHAHSYMEEMLGPKGPVTVLDTADDSFTAFFHVDAPSPEFSDDEEEKYPAHTQMESSDIPLIEERSVMPYSGPYGRNRVDAVEEYEAVRKDLNRSFYVWIAGKRYVFYELCYATKVPIFRINEIVMSLCQCSVVYPWEATSITLDPYKGDFRREEDVEMITLPLMPRVEFVGAAEPVRFGYLHAALSHIRFFGSLTFDIILVALLAPSVAFSSLGESRVFAQFIAFLCTAMFGGWVPYVGRWLLGSMLWSLLIERVYNPAENFRKRFNALITRLEYPKRLMLTSKNVHMVAAVVAFIGCVMIWWTKSGKKKRADTEGVQEDLEKLHTAIDAGESYVRMDSSRKDETFKNYRVSYSHDSVHTGPILELYAKIMKNVRRVAVKIGTVRRLGYALYVSRGCWIIPEHYFFGMTDEVTVDMWSEKNGDRVSGITSVRLCLEDVINIGNDLVMFRVVNLSCHNILNHISEGPGASHGVGAFKSEEVKVMFSRDPVEVGISDTNSFYILKEMYCVTYETKNGDCGLPLLFNRDKGSSICGIHVAGVGTKEKIGLSAVLYRSAVEDAINKLNRGVSEALDEPDERCFVSSKMTPMTVLEEPIPKSAFLHEEIQNITYHGKLPGNVDMKQKSRLKKSFLVEDEECMLDICFQAFGQYPTQSFVPPLMMPKVVNGVYLNPYNINLRKSDGVRKPLNRNIMRKTISYIVNHLIAGLKERKVDKLRPWNLKTAINGVTYDDFIRRINASTSAGFGLKGKKRDHLPKVDGEIRDLFEENKALFVQICDQLMKGEYVHFVHSASLKDEPRSQEKVDKGKTRVFFMSQLLDLIAMRITLGSFYTILVEHSDLFGACLGINMHREAGKLYEELLQFSDKWMEGDYGNYDVSMPPDIGHAANTIIYQVLKEFGYNDKALRLLNGVLAENLNVYVEMKRDLYSVFGFQPSGKYGTAEDNSLRGLIALVYFWFSESGKHKCDHLDFFSCVKPKLYGDDMLCAVKPEVQSWFNNVSYGQFVSQEYGMEFTSASKSADMQAFMPPNEASFLKRTFRWHNTMKCYVGCLDFNSIYKSLYWTEPSENASEADQQAMTIDAALRESFFHLDPSQYQLLRNYLEKRYTLKFGMTAKLRRTHFHEYSDLVAYYAPQSENSSPYLRRDEEVPVLPFSIPGISVCKVHCQNKDYGIISEDVFGRTQADEKKQWPTEEQDITRLIDELQNEYKSHTEFEPTSPMPMMTISDMRRTSEYGANESVRQDVEAYGVWKHRQMELDITIRNLQSAKARHSSNSRFKTQMEVGIAEEGKVDPANIVTREVVTDIGGEPDQEHRESSAIDVGIASHNQMADFLARPVLIGNLTLAVGADFNTVLDPWTLFFADPSVRAKLRNFAFLRGNLMIRIAISASPFHYGKVMIAYIPLAVLNSMYNKYIAGGNPYRPSFLNWLSQTDYYYVMDVGDNKPLEFEIPYINFKQNVRLFNQATTAVAGAFDDLTNLGRLVIKTLNQVQASNSTAPTSLSCLVYAYMEDAKLMGPTGSQIAITTESKNEHEVGPVEATATAALKAAEAFERVPWISPFAKASQGVFRGAMHIASAFGWSSPIVLPSKHMPSHMKNDAFQNQVTTITNSMAKKCTFDPLQELSIDPRVCAVSEDQLSLAYLCQKESLLDQWTWHESDTPMSTLLWKTYVTPTANFLGPAALGNTWVQPTSLSFAARPFNAWRGRIMYRFVIVRSQLHRGKIALIFEPDTCQYTLITSSLHMNKQRMLIIDIQETSEFVICVEWNNTRVWAPTAKEPQCNRAVGLSFLASEAVNMSDVSNGFLIMFPYTNLQCPDNTSNVYFNVYVSSPDMALNQLDTDNLPLLRATTQSLNYVEVAVDKLLGAEEDSTAPAPLYTILPDGGLVFITEKSVGVYSPVWTANLTKNEMRELISMVREKRASTQALTEYDSTCFQMNEPISSTAGMSEFHFGEQPVSFRPYLRRFFTSRTATSATFTGNTDMFATSPLYPPIRPALDGGAVTSSDIMSYLRYAFVGFRGEVRKRVRFRGPTYGALDHVKVQLHTLNSTTVALSLGVGIPFVTQRGVLTFVPMTNGGVEVALPYYSVNLFMPSGLSETSNLANPGDSNYSNIGYWCYSAWAECGPTASCTLTFAEETAYGDDFVLLHFIAAVPHTTAGV